MINFESVLEFQNDTQSYLKRIMDEILWRRRSGVKHRKDEKKKKELKFNINLVNVLIFKRDSNFSLFEIF